MKITVEDIIATAWKPSERDMALVKALFSLFKENDVSAAEAAHILHRTLDGIERACRAKREEITF